MAHPNEELVRRGYEAFARGDMDTLGELFDPGIVWHFPGRSVLAGDHRGVDAVLGFFGRTMELTAGTFRVEVHEVEPTISTRSVCTWPRANARAGPSRIGRS